MNYSFIHVSTIKPFALVASPRSQNTGLILRDQPNSREKMRDFMVEFLKNVPNFTENSRKEFEKCTVNSRAPQPLIRGAMLMQTKKSID